MKTTYISSADYRAQQEMAQSENIWQDKVMQAAKYANWLCMSRNVVEYEGRGCGPTLSTQACYGGEHAA